MKLKIFGGLLTALALLFTACSRQKKIMEGFIEKNIQFAQAQEKLQVDDAEKEAKILFPRTLKDGKIVYVNRNDWTCGFFPGTLWYLYELSGDSSWRIYAKKYTEALDSVKYMTTLHDTGFMIQCSYGNGYRLTGDSIYKDVIIRAAESLSTRFRSVVGVIQSWDVDKGWQSKRGWECPVIIDNMMNLELLFNATRLSSDSSYYKIAVSHANQTMKNHYRADYSCYHVVDYSLTNGSVRGKQTAQGYSDGSAWARGQAWGIYGFTVCYRETHNLKYLRQAEKAFGFVVHNKNFPSDFVPFWDFDAPNIPNVPRDVSAAAIMASALYEMSTYDSAEYYKGWADKIMNSLASPAYLGKLGENGNFLLMHSVGSIPHNQEIDVPLNYADYYFLEALERKREIETENQ